MTVPVLRVLLSGHRVGTLARTPRGTTVWTPEPGWLRGGQHPRLSLAMLREPGPMSAGTGVPPWFENLLPEPESALRFRLARLHGLRENDALGLLVALGSDLPGAVELVPETDLETTVEDGGHDGPGTRAEETALLRRWRFSLAGMQLKLSMTAQGTRLALTAARHDRRWIVKLPSRAYADLPAVEAKTMDWARASGHEVPPHMLVSTDDLDGLPEGWSEGCPTVYAIERFDRREDGTRIHHEDFCQALNIHPLHKYGDSGDKRFGHDGILRLVADAAGEHEARQLARRVGFVIASGNDDAHLKNWSFEWGAANRPKLSPCYDLVATVSWRDRHGWDLPGGPRLALSLGRVKRFALLDDEALRRHADRSGQPWARDEIMNGIERARTAWAAVEANAPPIMREALVEHWSRVPVLAKAGPLHR